MNEPLFDKMYEFRYCKDSREQIHITMPEESSLDEMIDAFAGFLAASGYNWEAIRERLHLDED